MSSIFFQIVIGRSQHALRYGYSEYNHRPGIPAGIGGMICGALLKRSIGANPTALTFFSKWFITASFLYFIFELC